MLQSKSSNSTVKEGKLSEFINSFRTKLDVNEATKIYVFQQNKFQSQMQLNTLITRDELEVMFKHHVWYQLQLNS